jgi:hypothetical protein
MTDPPTQTPVPLLFSDLSVGATNRDGIKGAEGEAKVVQKADVVDNNLKVNTDGTQNI